MPCKKVISNMISDINGLVDGDISVKILKGCKSSQKEFFIEFQSSVNA